MYNQNAQNEFNGRLLLKIHAVCDQAANPLSTESFLNRCDNAPLVVLSNMFIPRRYSEQVTLLRTVSIVQNV